MDEEVKRQFARLEARVLELEKEVQALRAVR